MVKITGVNAPSVIENHSDGANGNMLKTGTKTTSASTDYPRARTVKNKSNKHLTILKLKGRISTMEIILNSTEEKVLQKLADGKQTAYAENLLNQLKQFMPYENDGGEITPNLLLDALGNAGLSLVTYDSASHEFIASL